MSAGLGRKPAPDSRDLNYPLRAALPTEAPERTWRYWWSGGLWADQGATGTCVGHAWAHWIEDGPVTHPGEIDPFTIYLEAAKRDPWPQNDDGDLQFGTSVRAGVQYLESQGYIAEYRWAFDLDTAIKALLQAGPLVVGTNWYQSMFNPDANDLLGIGGPVVGGHAYVLNGVNTNTELVRMKNSWGRSWGRNGYAYLRFADLERLISEQGEACMALEQRL